MLTKSSKKCEIYSHNKTMFLNVFHWFVYERIDRPLEMTFDARQKAGITLRHNVHRHLGQSED